MQLSSACFFPQLASCPLLALSVCLPSFLFQRKLFSYTNKSPQWRWKRENPFLLLLLLKMGHPLGCYCCDSSSLFVVYPFEKRRLIANLAGLFKLTTYYELVQCSFFLSLFLFSSLHFHLVLQSQEAVIQLPGLLLLCFRLSKLQLTHRYTYVLYQPSWPNSAIARHVWDLDEKSRLAKLHGSCILRFNYLNARPRSSLHIQPKFNLVNFGNILAHLGLLNIMNGSFFISRSPMLFFHFILNPGTAGLVGNKWNTVHKLPPPIFYMPGRQFGFFIAQLKKKFDTISACVKANFS